MRTTIKRDRFAFHMGLEVWTCPHCAEEITLNLAYPGLRECWTGAVHHHLSHHFTIEQLEALVPAAPRCGKHTPFGDCNRIADHTGDCERREA